MKIYPGFKLSIKKSFSNNDIVAFSTISGDKNQLHLDELYASKSRFGKRICHGMLIGSLFSNIIGNNFPMSIYLNQTLSFKAPVYIDEEVKAEIEIEQIKKNILTLNTLIIKNDNTVALEGKAIVMIDNIKDYIYYH